MSTRLIRPVLFLVGLERFAIAAVLNSIFKGFKILYVHSDSIW